MPGYKRKRGNGTWQFEYTAGKDFTGKRIRYVKTVHNLTELQADKALARFVTECEDGLHKHSTPVTVADLCEDYMENYAKRYHKISTQRSDMTAINVWILPKLSTRKLNDLKKYDVQQWVNRISDEGKSPKTVRNCFAVLRQMLNYAVDMDLITTNPCNNVRMPKKKSKEMKSYTKEEIERMLECLDSLPDKELKFKCAILLALFGGFRKGEIVGFNWEDVNFDANEIQVKRTRMIAPNSGVYEDTPKTDKSQRIIVLPEFLISELKNLKKQQDEQRQYIGRCYVDSPALIKADDGEPLYPQVLQRWFSRFCEKNDLPPYGLHALRHTHASLLANMGADKVQVSNRLGHSQISTTLNIYTHLFESADTAIAENLNQMYKDKVL